MKNIKYLFIMVIAVMLTVSCSKDEPDDIIEPNEIEGTWKMDIKLIDTNGERYTAFTQTYTFNHDLSGNVLGFAYEPSDSHNSSVLVDLDFTYTAQEINPLYSEFIRKAIINGDSITTTYSYSITEDTLTLRPPQPNPLQVYVRQD